MDVTIFDSLTVWGLFCRGIGLVHLISFASLLGQVVACAGEHGPWPVRRGLARIERDFAGPRRFLYFPTLLWIDSSDRMLRGLALVGALAGAAVMVGGPHAPFALFVCYVCQLSLDIAMALIFPWDCLLFECTLLALFLPATRAFPDIAITALPPPAIAWAYRFLLFRVMFGFGKQKFVGSRRRDLAYLKGFLVNQPLPSKLAWYAQKLPLPLLQAAVCFMFVVEVPAPFLSLWPGLPSVVCAALTALLMIGIQAMGTFGYFSLITIVLCLPLLDATAPLSFSLSGAFDDPRTALATGFVAMHTLGALLAFPFNSWLGQSWLGWAYWYQLPRAVQSLLGALRLLHPFRWLHPYGVFPPNNTPAVKMVPLFEVSWDGKDWHELKYRFSPSHSHSPPCFIAPHHPRIDQALIYDTFGINATSLVYGVLGVWSPYSYASRAPLSFICQSVLRGDHQTFLLGDVLAAHSKPPTHVRVTTHMLEPVTLAEHAETGAFWRRRYVGPHRPAETLDPEFWEDFSSAPELWHFEAITWRRRSRLRGLIARAASGAEPVDELLLCEADGLEPRHASRFWSELVPMYAGSVRETFDTLPDVLTKLEQLCIDRTDRRALERVLARYALILVARFEPLFLHHGHEPLLAVPTYFHLWMLAHHVIGLGREAYARAYADPLSAAEHIPNLTPQTGLYGLALFRYEAFRFEAQKLRLIEAFTYPHDPAAKRVNAQRMHERRFQDLPRGERFVFRVAMRVSGYFHILPVLRDAFRGERFEAQHPERYPSFSEDDSGVVRMDDAIDATHPAASGAPDARGPSRRGAETIEHILPRS